MEEDILTLIEKLTREFIEAGGGISCEISLTHLSGEIGVFLIQQNKKLESLHHFWVALPCWVCQEVHGSGSWHLEIMKNPYALEL